MKIRKNCILGIFFKHPDLVRFSSKLIWMKIRKQESELHGIVRCYPRRFGCLLPKFLTVCMICKMTRKTWRGKHGFSLYFSENSTKSENLDTFQNKFKFNKYLF